MTPAQAIAALDRQLVAHGEDVTLRKGNTTVGQKTVRAFVRGFKPEQLVGTLTQASKRVTLSPTGLDTYGLPQRGQFVLIDGTPRSIDGEPEFIHFGGELVRINLTVTG
jgi:hypothetical protein